MVIATELFLEKVECLSALLKEMKTFESCSRIELEKIEADLEKLKEHVEIDKCLNAGGKFEWVDSILVKVICDLLFIVRYFFFSLISSGDCCW